MSPKPKGRPLKIGPARISIEEQLTRSLGERYSVQFAALPDEDAYSVIAHNEEALYSFFISGRDIDSAGGYIVSELKDRIKRALP